MFGLLCLAPISKKKENTEEALLDPEMYRKYKGYGSRISEKAVRKIDYSSLYDKPYRLKNDKKSDLVKEKVPKEESPFADLWK